MAISQEQPPRLEKWSWLTTISSFVLSLIVSLVNILEARSLDPETAFSPSSPADELFILRLLLNIVLIGFTAFMTVRLMNTSNSTLLYLIRSWLKGKREPSIVWLCKTRLGHVTRAMAIGATGIVPILVAFGLGLLLFYLYVISNLGSYFAVNLITALIMVSFVGSVLVHGAYRTLYALPPHDYAKLTIGGAQFSDALMAISFDVWKVCFKFLKHPSVRELDAIEQVLRNCPEANIRNKLKEEQPKIEKCIKEMKHFAFVQSSAIQRLIAMKKLAAAQCDIPPRRYCDYLVRFSPVIFGKRLHKYIQNWEELLEFDTRQQPNYLQRLRTLLSENQAFHNDIYQRLVLQEQNLRHHDLHFDLHLLIAEHSTSTSLIHYARAISRVAKITLKSFNGRTDFLTSDEFYACIERLRFLYEAQRAHSGSDLHTAAWQLLYQEKERLGPTRANNTITLQERILCNLIAAPGHHVFSTSDEMALTELKELALLAVTVDTAIARMREEIVSNFSLVMRQWLEQTGNADGAKTVYIVTHGYSQTVLAVLKQELAFAWPHLRVFILKSDDQDSIDSRQMHETLAEIPKHSQSAPIATGDEELFSRLLTSDSMVLILLGAECFDRNRRMVHPRMRQIYRLKGNISSKTHCVVMVVGESYKCHRNLVDVLPFFQDHLDRVNLYDEDFVDTIISDGNIGCFGKYTTPVANYRYTNGAHAQQAPDNEQPLGIV